MTGYLLDTNSVIYFFSGEGKISELIKKARNEIYISFITKIELLCFEVDDKETQRKINEFLKEIRIIFIDDEIIAHTITYRKKYKMKVPDAIICATSRVLGLTLVTGDKLLQKKVEGINIISPI